MVWITECGKDGGGSSHNVCVQDECASDDDCAGGACTPDGFDIARHCIAAGCHSDADCTDEPGGVCLILEGGCCRWRTEDTIRRRKRPKQLACAYPSDGCQTDADCVYGSLNCVAEAGRAHCGECNAESSVDPSEAAR